MRNEAPNEDQCYTTSRAWLLKRG